MCPTDQPQDDLAFKTPADCDRPYTVSQINAIVAARVESGNALVWFEGEVSNYKRSTAGHCYLTLKDAQSQISAVIWRSNVDKLKVVPENGMEVTGIASVRVYRKGGTYQLDVHRLQPSGLGALSVAFEALKKRLQEEGLFAQERKRPIPKAVRVLGVVTSRSGAAIRDIVRVVNSRAPHTDILLMNVPVQGEGAAARIADAIQAMGEYGRADCLIVGRGGGSIEDLWAFNEEVVARAIFESAIPVISAVGHETDFTIADFVADVRAATPSAAAEMAVADAEEGRRYFMAAARRFVALSGRFFADARERFASLARRPALQRALRVVQEGRQALDEARGRQLRALGTCVRQQRSRLESAAARLTALSPLSVLGRGYAVVTRADGTVVRESTQLAAGDEVCLRLHKGRAWGSVSRTEAEG